MGWFVSPHILFIHLRQGAFSLPPITHLTGCPDKKLSSPRMLRRLGQNQAGSSVRQRDENASSEGHMSKSVSAGGFLRVKSGSDSQGHRGAPETGHQEEESRMTQTHAESPAH